MPSRRKHSKSRHGCAQCKAAHIKCDLAHPTCGKCMKTRKSCQFPDLIEARSSNAPTTPHDQSTPGTSLLLSTISPPDGTTLAPGIPSSSEAEIVSWEDLELLHHYLTVTYTTMASRDDLRQMWRIQVPKMALKQKFLMHSIFSVTSLHIAYSHPEIQSSYIDRAIRHHNIALREYSSKLHSITRENSTSLFACATLIVIFSLNLAVSRPRQESSGPVEEISGIFMLLRGVHLVLGETWDWVKESEIAPMFAGRELDDTIVLSDDAAAAIKLLEDRNQLSSKSESAGKTYALAIQGLRECFKLILSNDRDNGMVLSWPILFGQEYIALLCSRQPMALVILAHYAVILDEIRDTWWVMGWGSQLIQEIYQVVNADWKSLVAWPADKVGARGQCDYCA